MNAQRKQQVMGMSKEELQYSLALKRLTFVLRMNGVLYGTTEEIDAAITSGHFGSVINLNAAERFCVEHNLPDLFDALERMAG